MANFIDLTGREFGRLKVIERDTSVEDRVKWICKCECGKTKSIFGGSLRRGATTSCGCRQFETLHNNPKRVENLRQWNKKNRGDKHPLWKGGRHVSKSGYVHLSNVVSPPEFSLPRRMMEHQYVMALRLGRALLPGENVHHKNTIRGDNRDENLELWLTRQPSGQRVEDALEWAREIFNRYAIENWIKDEIDFQEIKMA